MYKKANTKSKEELVRDIENENFRRKTLSFYKYTKIADPKGMRDMLVDKFIELKCLGRIYVAHEGINAQMNVLTQYWAEFDAWVQAQPELAGRPLTTLFKTLQNLVACLIRWQ